MAKVLSEEGQRKLKQLEQIIERMEKSTVTSRADVIELAKIVWWLLNRWCREH